MSRPSHSSRFYHPNNIGWGVHLLVYKGTSKSKVFLELNSESNGK
jgi:hypothetical protein